MPILTITPKENLYEAVEWYGFMEYANYPYWLQRLIDGGKVYETPNSEYYVDNNRDEEIVSGGTFVKNRFGKVKYYPFDEFIEEWVVVDETTHQYTCVVSSVSKLFDAVEWQGMDMKKSYPYWFQELIEQGYVYNAVDSRLRREAIHYSSADGELAVCEGDVFVVNPWGDVKLYDESDFHKEWTVVSADETDMDYYTS